MATADPPEWIAGVQRRLSETNGFTPEELALNRDSLRVARSQRARLFRQAVGDWWGLAAIPAASVWIYLTALLLIRPVEGISEVRWAPALLWLLAAFLTAVTVRPALRLARFLADLSEGQAHCLEGKLHASSSYITGQEPVDYDADEGKPWGWDNPRVYGPVKYDRYAYTIGQDAFPVELDAYRALHPYSGSTCRVYITPRRRLFLSCELVTVRVSAAERNR